MLRGTLIALLVSASTLATEIKIEKETKALLVKVKYKTTDASITRLVPGDFKVSYSYATNAFTLTRQFCPGFKQAETTPAPREVDGTAVILVHWNQELTRNLEMGPGLTLVSATPLKP